MSKIIKIAVFSLLAGFIFSACSKQVNKIYYEGGTAPVLTVVEGSNVEYANADKMALVLNWTNPDYQLTTGVSSQDVNYNIQIDTAGSNFSNPYEITVTKDLTYSFTVSQLNDVMQNQLNLLPAMAHTLEIKVIASMANNTVPLASDSIQFVATPYVIPPKVAPPASGTLYIVGSAVVGGWDNPIAESNVPGQQLTQLSLTEYTLTTQLVGDGEFKFIETNGSWDKQWSVKEEQPSGDATTFGTDIVFNGGNVRAPQQSGTYKIDVDFQKGKYSVTKQ